MCALLACIYRNAHTHVVVVAASHVCALHNFRVRGELVGQVKLNALGVCVCCAFFIVQCSNARKCACVSARIR